MPIILNATFIPFILLIITPSEFLEVKFVGQTMWNQHFGSDCQYFKIMLSNRSACFDNTTYCKCSKSLLKPFAKTLAKVALSATLEIDMEI